MQRKEGGEKKGGRGGGRKKEGRKGGKEETDEEIYMKGWIEKHLTYRSQKRQPTLHSGKGQLPISPRLKYVY